MALFKADPTQNDKPANVGCILVDFELRPEQEAEGPATPSTRPATPCHCTLAYPSCDPAPRNRPAPRAPILQPCASSLQPRDPACTPCTHPAPPCNQPATQCIQLAPPRARAGGEEDGAGGRQEGGNCQESGSQGGRRRSQVAGRPALGLQPHASDCNPMHRAVTLGIGLQP